ncbi:hypothetical protein HYI36_20440 [Bacillus sp. Gen3]|nr:hypothetical protein [Bacillus sp. Gen3]
MTPRSKEPQLDKKKSEGDWSAPTGKGENPPYDIPKSAFDFKVSIFIRLLNKNIL